MTRPILLAGLLGGLLGGVVSFAASRWIVPAEPAKRAPGAKLPIPPEARSVLDAYIAELEAMKYEEFAAEVKRGVAFLDEKFKDRFLESRKLYHGVFGNRTDRFELIRESALSKDLVEFVYLEKFEHGMVVWFFVFNQTSDGWRLARVFWNEDISVAFLGSQ